MFWGFFNKIAFKNPTETFESRNILSKMPISYISVAMVRSLREQCCKINPSQVKQDSVLLGFMFLHVGCASEPLRVTQMQLHRENGLFIEQMYCMSAEKALVAREEGRSRQDRRTQVSNELIEKQGGFCLFSWWVFFKENKPAILGTFCLSH